MKSEFFWSDPNAGRRHDKIERSNSFRLMDCFDTPPQRTIFGTKNSEHWDSFQSKYASSFESNHHHPFDRDEQAIRRRYKLQSFNHDGTVQPPEFRKQPQQSKWSRLLWLFKCCWKFPRRTVVDRELDLRDDYHDEIDYQKKKRLSLMERYSDYFERRNVR